MALAFARSLSVIGRSALANKCNNLRLAFFNNNNSMWSTTKLPYTGTSLLNSIMARTLSSKNVCAPPSGGPLLISSGPLLISNETPANTIPAETTPAETTPAKATHCPIPTPPVEVEKKGRSHCIFPAIWKDADCNNPIKISKPERFDDLYYRITDKTNMQYERTWAEFPERQIVPKRLCIECLEPPIKRRVREKPTAKLPEIQKCRTLKEEINEAEAPIFRRITMKGCRAARIPPRCGLDQVRKPRKCQRVCAPRPAFSECLRPSLQTPRHTECRCWKVAMRNMQWGVKGQYEPSVCQAVHLPRSYSAFSLE